MRATCLNGLLLPYRRAPHRSPRPPAPLARRFFVPTFSAKDEYAACKCDSKADALLEVQGLHPSRHPGSHVAVGCARPRADLVRGRLEGWQPGAYRSDGSVAQAAYVPGACADGL